MVRETREEAIVRKAITEMLTVAIETVPQSYPAAQLTDTSQVPQFLAAMGYVERPYRIEVTASSRFTVELLAKTGTYFPESLHKGDWLWQDDDGDIRVLSATEFEQYWRMVRRSD